MTQPAWVAAYEEAPLYSKIAGCVHEVLVDIGQRATQGQSLVRLHVPEMDDDLKQMDSLVEQAATQVRQARAAVAAVDAGADGDPVVVRVASLNHEEFPGHVTRTSWSLDSDNRSLRVEVDLDNPQGRLRPGMYATCSILLAERESTRAVPISAIVQQDRASYCWCVVGGALQRKRLELGLRCGSLVEVLGGLADDDLVVRVASEALQEGLPVEVIAP